MRHHVALGTLALVLGIGCGAEGSAPADADAKTVAKAAVDGSGKAEAKGAAKAETKAEAKVGANVEGDAAAELAVEIKPRIGGTIVATGEYNVEILAFVDGRVEAIVMDAKGELVAFAEGKLQLAATLAAKADAKASIDLKWDVELARFVGQVDAALELVPGPIAISLTVDGKANAGALAELGLAAHAHHGGQIMVAGAYSIEIVAQGEAVHAYAFDVAGEAHAKGDLNLQLETGAAAKLDLKWDPPSASYTAKLEGDLVLEAKPIVLRVVADGKVALAAVQSFHASAKLALAGDAKASADAHAKGSAKAGAKAGVHEHASTSGKASVKGGAKASGGIKASIGGSAKGGIKIGG